MATLIEETLAKFDAEGVEQMRDFQEQWRNNTLSDDHVVMVKVKKWSRTIAYKFKRPQHADDLEQATRIALSSCDYQGKSKLDTYIVRILLNENSAEWRKSGAQRQGELSANVPDVASQELMDAVLARVSLEKYMGRHLASRPDFHREVLRVVIEAEREIGRQRIAEVLSGKLDRKVTRYEVEVALEQMRATAGLR